MIRVSHTTKRFLQTCERHFRDSRRCDGRRDLFLLGSRWEFHAIRYCGEGLVCSLTRWPVYWAHSYPTIRLPSTNTWYPAITWRPVRLQTCSRMLQCLILRFSLLLRKGRP